MTEVPPHASDSPEQVLFCHQLSFQLFAAERWRSPAAGSRSAAEAVGSQVQRLIMYEASPSAYPSGMLVVEKHG